MVELPDWVEPLLEAGEMRATDRWAIEQRGAESLALMERAGSELAAEVVAMRPQGPVRVVCGKGNNGGDGLVAARHLTGLGMQAEVVLVTAGGELSPDAKVNRDRLPSGVTVIGADSAPAMREALAGSAVIVDALLGTGFSGVPKGPVAEAINAINASGAPVLAADVASGVDASSGEVAPGRSADGAPLAVRATRTVTFHAAQVGHFVAPGKSLTGKLRVAPIGIPSGPVPGVEPTVGLITEPVLDRAPRRGAASTKFSSGAVLIAGGSRGLTGAVCLAAEAAIRAGAGYATAFVPADLEPILEQKLTEVMTVGCQGGPGHLGPKAAATVVERAERAGAVLLGSGLGRQEEAFEFARELAPAIGCPLLIDADGLNAFSGQPERLADRGRGGDGMGTVLTPHEGELARLLETDADAIKRSRLASAKAAAERTGAVVVLKGDDTLVTDGRRVAINSLPSPALATAGTGDVLAGLMAALISRGMDLFEAACAAVIAHARAGRWAAEQVGSAESVIASDVIGALPSGLRR